MRLIVPKDCVLLWHEQCLHSGASSRANLFGVHQDDIRLFSDVWTDGSTHLISRSLTRVQKQDETQVYRQNELPCEDFFNIKKKTPYIAHNALTIHVCRILVIIRLPYNHGDRILGNLKLHGWVLLGRVRIDKETQYSLNAISSSGKWYPIEDSKISMKYKLGSPMHSNLRTDNWMVTLMQTIKQFFYRNLPNRKYCFGKYNLLKNDGEVKEDQKPHYDYPFQNNS